MTILEMRRKRAALADEAGKLIPSNGGKMSSETRLKFEKIMEEVDRLKDDIAREERSADPRERHEELDRELRETTRPPEANIGDAFDEARSASNDRQYRRAFVNFLRHGLYPDARGSRGITDEDRSIILGRQAEMRDQSVGTTTAGGYFVPQGFVYQVEQAMKWYGSTMESSEIMDTATGAPMPYPTSDDTSSVGEQIDENTQVTDLDVAVGQIMFNAFKYSTKLVKCSLELIQDSAFDMEQFLAQQFGMRLGRILNTKFTVGVGTTEPKGIVTCATSGAVATGAAANTGGSDSNTNTIGSTDLVELEHSVDRAYRRGASYSMSDTALRGLKEVLDKYGRPIWKAGLAGGTPDTLNGYPYWINNDIAIPAASAKSMLFGDHRKYLIRRVKQLTVLRLIERFADYGQVAFIGFARYDGNLRDGGNHPVKYLIQHS